MLFILSVIIILILSLVYIKIGDTQKNNNKIGYSDENDEYEKPYLINNLISINDCKKIIEFSKDKLIDSLVVGGKHNNIRNSKQHWIPKNNPLVKELFEKISSAFNIPFENAEDLQVVRYLPNQFYNEHHDACCDDNIDCNNFIKRGGQRKLTVLIYLNNDFEGGFTFFKNMNLKLKPKTGDAIIFHPLAKKSNKCHPKALHAGMPVTKGEKWIANLWFRESKFI